MTAGRQRGPARGGRRDAGCLAHDRRHRPPRTPRPQRDAGGLRGLGRRSLRRGARERIERGVPRPHLPPRRGVRRAGRRQPAGPAAASARRRADRRRRCGAPPDRGRLRPRLGRLRRGPDPPPDPRRAPGSSGGRPARSGRWTASSRPPCAPAGARTPGSTDPPARSPTSPSTGSRRRSGGSTARTILVAGVGRMGRLAAFAAHRRGARVVVMNRTDARAAALAARGRWRRGRVRRRRRRAARRRGDRRPRRTLAGRAPRRRPRSSAAAAGRGPLVAALRRARPPGAARRAFTSVDDLVVGPEFAPAGPPPAADREARGRGRAATTASGCATATLSRSSRRSPPRRSRSASDELAWLLRRLPGARPGRARGDRADEPSPGGRAAPRAARRAARRRRRDARARRPRSLRAVTGAGVPGRIAAPARLRLGTRGSALALRPVRDDRRRARGSSGRRSRWSRSGRRATRAPRTPSGARVPS